MEKERKKETKVILQLPLKKVRGTCHITSNTVALAAREAGPH